MAKGTCRQRGCTTKVKARGYCGSHYAQRLRTGKLKIVRPQRPDEERFWSKVDASGVCWEWTGSLHPRGYGYFTAKGKKGWRVHRYAWTNLVGPIPEGMTLDHLCRNKRCVNPDHMEITTPAENNLRGGSMSALNARKTHCKRGHEFTPENTERQYNKNGGRRCRTCRLEYIRKRYAEQRGNPRRNCP